MTPRPYRPDPNCQVYYGHWPFGPSEGVIPEGARYFLENPPDPRHGLTLVKRRGKVRYYKKLKSSDQLSQAEAAVLLHVSRMQLNRWVREGMIPDRKVLGTSRIRVADLVAFARKKRMSFFRL